MSIKKVPLRQYIGCGKMKTKKEMIRVLETSEGEITLDATNRKNDCGTYVRPTMECLKEAIKSRGLECSLKTATPREMCEALEKEMEQLGGQKRGV